MLEDSAVRFKLNVYPHHAMLALLPLTVHDITEPAHGEELNQHAEDPGAISTVAPLTV